MPNLHVPWLYRFWRVRRPEAMDQPGLDPVLHQIALQGLERIATWPGQREPIFHWVYHCLGQQTAGASQAALAPVARKGRRWRIVELGAGSGHFSLWLAARLLVKGIVADVIPTDAQASPGVLALDVSQPEKFPEADLYISNLLWHHLPDEVVVKMLQGMQAKARLGWMAYDLHRHWLHYYGAQAVMRWQGLHPILLSDGAKSIQQGYSRKELKRLLRQADCGAAKVEWKFPFRWLVSYRKVLSAEK